jgi:integrase/recombinase XerD
MLKTDYYEICKRKLKYFNYSERTIECYLYYIDKFLESYSECPSRLTSKDFQNYLDNYNFTSISQQNQIINAIRFLYKYGLEKKYDKVSFHRPRKEHKLPQIIDKNYLISKINSIENKKHKALLTIGYSAGIRVSEVINLKICDIDSKRMIITIKNGKGRKDRICKLSENALNVLREYYKQYKPKEFLFNGQFSEQYTTSSCNAIVRKYIGEQYHWHLLRHSCFTSTLEAGGDLRSIQMMAGHSSIKTTTAYLHLSQQHLQKLPIPL